MFTGIVQHKGSVRSIEPAEGGVVLRIDLGAWSHTPETGSSISVNGCCLTVTEDEAAGEVRFDVVPETLARTTLGSLRVGDPVNLEHAVTPTTLLGGHVVQGHIDGVGVVTEVMRGGEWRVHVEPPAELLECIIEKGSIAVDGVSLTVAARTATGFEVALIPETLAKTTLGQADLDTRVNIETDYLARTVIHWLRQQATTTP